MVSRPPAPIHPRIRVVPMPCSPASARALPWMEPCAYRIASFINAPAALPAEPAEEASAILLPPPALKKYSFASVTAIPAATSPALVPPIPSARTSPGGSLGRTNYEVPVLVPLPHQPPVGQGYGRYDLFSEHMFRRPPFFAAQVVVPGCSRLLRPAPSASPPMFSFPRSRRTCSM